jgi:hypothetical protein
VDKVVNHRLASRKNTCNASVESKGFCHYKCTNGIKRHLAVDTLGLPFFTHCTKASVSDDQGLIELLSHNLDYFRAKPVNIPKITILLDHGYHPDKLTVELQKLYPQIMTKIRFELAPKPTKAEKAAQGKTGFVVGNCFTGRIFQSGCFIQIVRKATHKAVCCQSS